MPLRRVPVDPKVLDGAILVDVSKAREYDNDKGGFTDKVLGVSYECAFPLLKYATARVVIPESAPLLFPNYEDEDFELEPGQVVELTGAKRKIEAYIGRSGLGLSVEADGIKMATPAPARNVGRPAAAAASKGDD